MKTSSNNIFDSRLSKSNIAVASLIVLLLSTVAFSAVPMTIAHDPAWNVPTYAYIVASPDPVGVGQPVFLVFWLDKVPPTAGGTGGDRWTDFTLKITKPDGSVENRGPYISDATSAAWDIFYPQQEGVYSILFEYPGQTASLYHPETGIPGDATSAYIGDYFEPSSATTTFTVQSEQVRESPTYPLPSSFWTRPIEGQNTQWSYIASNYLGAGVILDKVQPNGKAPGSAHVMWTKTFQDGGIIGGDYWGVPSAAYYTGLSYEGKFNNPIIINGRLYYKAALSNSQTAGPYMCVDLLTGETIWENNDINPTFGMIYLYESMNQHGAMEGYLVQSITAGGFFATSYTWVVYDSRTGNWLFNMTGVPTGFGPGFFGGYGSGALGSNGEILNYQLGNGWLALWSSAAEPNTPLVATPGNTTDAFQYRPYGKNADMSQAYLWNITIPALPAGSSIQMAIPNDILLLSTTISSGFFGWGTNTYTMTALGLNEDNLGQILWQKTYQPPTGNKSRSLGPIDPVNRVFTMTEKETMQWYGFDLDSGNQLWGPVGDFRDFQYYGQVSNPPAPGHIYDGKLIVGGYGGELHCFDTLSGDLLWKYNDTYCGTETPWGLYTLFVAGIADGKVYCFSSEHSPNVPLYKGSMMRCISVEDGSELWTLDSWYAIGSFGQSPVPIADGYMAYLNVYDMQVYCIGKGPSKLTVEAPMTGVNTGEAMMIRGTIEDICAGAKAKVASGEFNIVPAMADESMHDWMAYIYQQKPMPMDAVGVPITLIAFNDNGEETILGTVTSDSSGMFKKSWTPSVAGEYTIVASFDGTESYWPSSAETAVVVTVASAQPTTEPTTSTSASIPPTESPTQTIAPTPTPAVEPDADNPTDTLLIVGAAVVIIAIVGAAAVLLRKRA